MESEGVKTVVFGVGASGCKLLDRLAGSAINAEFVALDTERSRLDSLVGRIAKVAIGEAMQDRCNTIDGLRSAFKGELPKMGNMLFGTSIAVVIVSSEDEGSTCMAELLLEFCKDRRILALLLALHEGNSAGSGGRLAALKNKSDGLVLIADTASGDDKDLAAAGAFERASSQAACLVGAIISSASSVGFATMRTDELRRFFHNGLFFVLARGEAESFNDACKAASSNAVSLTGPVKTEKILAMVSSQTEIEIEHLKAATLLIEDHLNASQVDWIQLQSDTAEIILLLLCGVSDIPNARPIVQQADVEKTEVVESKKTPIEDVERPITGTKIEPSESKRPIATLLKFENGESPAKEAPKEPEAQISEIEEIPIIGERANRSSAPQKEQPRQQPLLPAYQGAEEPAAEKPSAEEVSKREEPGGENVIGESDLAAELGGADKGEEIAVGKEGKIMEQKTLDIPIQVEDIIEKQISEPKVKSPALLGMHRTPLETSKLSKDNPKLPQRSESLPPEPEEDVSIDDIVNDLIGMPTFKGKGQKRLGDYRDGHSSGRYVNTR